MTAEELEAIRQRAQAVPGWILAIDVEYHHPEPIPLGGASLQLPSTIRRADVALRLEDGSPVLVAGRAESFMVGATAVTFLQHAPGDVRALLEEVDRLRAELEDAYAPGGPPVTIDRPGVTIDRPGVIDWDQVEAMDDADHDREVARAQAVFEIDNDHG